MNETEWRAIEFLVAGDHPFLAILRAQLARATVAGREFTGAGFFTHFAVPPEVERLPGYGRYVIGDVHAEMKGLAHGAGFLLFTKDGCIDLLECYTNDGTWPPETELTRLYYMRPSLPRGPRWETLVESAERDFERLFESRPG